MISEHNLGITAIDRLRSGGAVLAPMSGVTDIGFRRIAQRFGASLTISEMVASRAFALGAAEASMRSEGEGIDIHVVQLVGGEARWLAEAARVAEGAGAAIIDINMGCPAKCVTGIASGSALMRDIDHALSLIEAVVAAVQVPVTVKMRLGWDDATRNAPELARRAEAAGVALVTVHGRTRQQFYKGRADWHAVGTVRAAVSMPVIANGDIEDAEGARACLAASGANAVMVGRAAIGQPWLVGQIAAALAGRDYEEPDIGEKISVSIEHYEALLTLYGKHVGVRHARKHLAAYGRQIGLDPAALSALVRTDEPQQVLHLLRKGSDASHLELAA